MSISAGRFEGPLEVLLHGSATATISGGSFSQGSVGFRSLSTLDVMGDGAGALNITGGLFSGPMTFDITNNATVNIFGTDLQFDAGTGLLTGVLEDGNQIDSSILLGPYSHVSYNFGPNGEEVTFSYSTPEPSSLVLLALGIAGAALACKSKRVRRRLFPDSVG